MCTKVNDHLNLMELLYTFSVVYNNLIYNQSDNKETSVKIPKDILNALHY